MVQPSNWLNVQACPSQSHMTVHTCTYMYQQIVELHMETARSTSLVPRREGGGGERVPGTHCLCMRLITMEFRGDRVRTCTYTYTGDIINSLRWSASSCAVGVLFEWILYCAVLCLLVAEYLETKLKKEQVYAVINQFRQVHSYHGLPDISLCTWQYTCKSR